MNKDMEKNTEMEKIAAEELEQVQGGLNNAVHKIGGYLDRPTPMEAIMNSEVDTESVNPIAGAGLNPIANHPVIKDYVDSALPEKPDKKNKIFMV